MTETYYFRARVDQFVAGMDDTVVMGIEGESLADVIDRACEQRLDHDDWYRIKPEVWKEHNATDYDNGPSCGPLHYLGIHDELFTPADGPVLLSAIEGTKVTSEMIEEDGR